MIHDLFLRLNKADKAKLYEVEPKISKQNKKHGNQESKIKLITNDV